MLVSNISKVLSGTALAHLIVMGSMPIITRLYDPEAFGISVVIISLAATLSVFTTMRLEIAITLANKDKIAQVLVQLSFIFLIVAVLLTLFVILIFDDYILKLIGLTESQSYFLWFIPLLMLISSLNNIAIGFVQYEKRFYAIGFAELIKAFFNSISKINFGYFYLSSPIFLIIGPLLGGLVSFVYLLSKWSKLFQLKSGLRYMSLVIKRYKQFPLYDLPSAFLNRISQSMPIFILSSFYDPRYAGFYSLAYIVLFLPVSLVSSSVKKVVIKELAEKYNKKEKNYKLVVKITSILFLIGLIPFSILFFYAEDLFVLIFSESWRDAGVIAGYMSIWLFLLFFDASLVSVYQVYKLQHFKLGFQVFSFLIKTVAFLVLISYLDNALQVLFYYFITAGFLHVLFLLAAFLLMNIEEKKWNFQT